MKNVFRFILGLTAVGFFLFSRAEAQVVYDAHVHAQLIPEARSVQPGHPLWVGLHMKMDDHWHVYWKNPGDSGLPPVIHWNLPAGFKASTIYYPIPQKIDQPPLRSYGYLDEVLFLTRIEVPADLKEGETVSIAAKVDWLACEVPCIPGKGNFSFEIPVFSTEPKLDAAWSTAFEKTRKNLPVDQVPWTATAGLDHDRIIVRLQPQKNEPLNLKDIYLFPESSELIAHPEEQKLRKTKEGYELSVMRSTIQSQIPATLKGLLVSSTGWDPEGNRGWTIDVPFENNPSEIPISNQSRQKPLSLIQYLLYAFLGGIILNLMPCVFPVLSLKVLTFVHQAKEQHRQAWQHGILFTVGVLVSFWILAGLLMAFRAAGQEIGWGFQFQSPAFVVFLTALFFLLALNLFGVFEIEVMGLSTQASAGKGLSGPFFSGVLATIVATPCTAPFMGAALGFALTQPPVVSLLIFTFLGLGLAAPVLILSRFPKLLGFIPKPGLWMIRLKQLLGFLLMGAVIWLLWVIGESRGVSALVQLLIGLLIMGLGAWLWGTQQSNPNSGKRKIVLGLFCLFIVGGFLLGLDSSEQVYEDSYLTIPNQSSDARASGITWKNYSPQVLQEALAQDNIVFLDFTAAWCLTCKVNERVALSNSQVIQKFKDLDIVAIKVDWTNNNPDITKLLATYGKNSIPLYVVYQKDRSRPPLILPELITPNIVLESLDHLKR